MANSAARTRITRELLFTAFAGVSVETEDPIRLDRLTSAVVAEDVEPGHVLYRQGEPSSDVYFMTEGRVRVTCPGRRPWIHQGRWVLGTTDVLLGRPRSRTAVMETQARLFHLAAAQWFEAVDGRPAVLLNALVGFARGIADLYVRLAPDGGFASPEGVPALHTDSLAARARALAATSLFSGIPMQALVELASIGDLRTLRAEDELFAAGRPSGRVYVVTRGRIEARREAPEVRGVFGPGAVVGGAVCMGDPEGAWSARALETTETLSFGLDDLFDAVEEHQRGVRAMMGAFAAERERACDVLAERLGELVLT
jgi:CRP-like cAMP-binding protein